MRSKGRYIPDPETAWVVRLIYDLAVSGLTLDAIAKKLDDEGIPTPSQILERREQPPKNRVVSLKWNPTTVRLILRQPAYVGRLRGWSFTSVYVEEVHPISGEPIEKKKQFRRADDDPEVIIFSPDVCPSLVDEKAFEAVALILKRNQENASRNLSDPQSLLLRGGFGLCGYCGRTLSGMKARSGGPYRYYCTSSKHTPCEGGRFSWLADEMDDLTWRWVMHQFENPDVLRKKFDQWKADQVEGRAIEYDRLASLKDMIAKGTRSRQNCMASAADAEDDETRLDFTHMAEEISRQIRSWSEEYDQLTKVISQAEEFKERVESIVALGQKAKEHLQTATFDDKRVTIYAFDVQVTAWRHDHTPPFEFSWGFDRLHEAWVHSRRFLGREGTLCVDSHPWLTVAAGGGLAVVMVSAAGFHLSRGEGSHVPGNVVLLILAVLVVIGRIAIAPAVA
jgi:hypothetical protein